MAPGDLQEVLDAIKPGAGGEIRDLLVGLGRADDAAVYRLTPDLAIVETVDFFPPVVDDAYTWGAIAAVNAMSDVYAMGGEVLFALAVAGFPRDMPKKVIADVFRGGAAKVAEAGGVIAGGHTVVDAEPKYGLCVTGRVHPDRVLIKGGLRPGDRVFLSKPLGTGVITTAAKDDATSPEILDGAVASMLRLNRVAAQIAQDVGVRGATDITGFGLLGHASHIARASDVTLRIDANAVPVLPGTIEAWTAGARTGGAERNATYLEALVEWRALPDSTRAILFDPQTSGGLLIAVAQGAVAELIASLPGSAEIGEVTSRGSAAIVVR